MTTVRSRAVAIIAAVTLLSCAASAGPAAKFSVGAVRMGGLCAHVDVAALRGFGSVAEQRHGDGHAPWPAAAPRGRDFASAQFCLLRVGRGVVMLDALRYADAAAARREHPRRQCEQGFPLAIGDYGCAWLETVPMVMPMTGREENAFLGNAEVVVRDIVVRATAISGGDGVEVAMASAGVTSLIDVI
jgi:hypothetical protein